MRAELCLAAAIAAGCGAPAPAVRPIRFLTTFSPRETELFHTTIAERGLAVDVSLVPFARGHQVITEMLRAGKDCPDLIRIDATWLPSLVDAKVLAQPPAELQTGWAPLGKDLAVVAATQWAVPQSIDGLVAVRFASTPAPADPSIAALQQAAGKTGKPHSLGVRVDGYWFVPWLRAAGVELAPDQLDQRAVGALREFGAMFGTLAAPPPSAGSEAESELRRWNARELAYWITGPWQLADLRDRDQLAVSAIAHAPRGGQLLVVPACADQPAQGWRLAQELTSERTSLIFSDAFATIPTLEVAQQHATPLVQQVMAALASAERLPVTPVTPLLFDDLNPAVAAVVFGDATPDEAIAGVRRGWQRLTVKK